MMTAAGKSVGFGTPVDEQASSIELPQRRPTGKFTPMKNKQNWPLLMLAMVVGGVVANQFSTKVAAAAGHEKVIRAEQYVLVGRDGVRRAAMRVTGGAAVLAMFDGAGRDRAEFRVPNDGGAQLGFYDKSGSQRVVVGETPGGRNGIAIYATGGRQIASLSVAEDNQASLTLYDPQTGKARAGLGTAANGSPALVLFDQQGKDRIELHVKPNGKPGIALADENGKRITEKSAQE
jgi:hypothetical protein